MPRDEPLHQRAARVQRDGQLAVLLEHVQKRTVAVLVGLLKHAVEVSDRLMIMEHEDKSERRTHVEKSYGSFFDIRATNELGNFLESDKSGFRLGALRSLTAMRLIVATTSLVALPLMFT